MTPRPQALSAAFALLAAACLAACGGGAPQTPQAAAPGAPPAGTATAAATPGDGPRARAAPVTDAEALALMDALIDAPSDGPARAALGRIADSGDRRFAAVLIDALFGRRARLIATGPDALAYGDALGRLTGETFGSDYFRWIEWYGATDLIPPPGYASWKGRLFSRIDGRFGDFLRSEHPSAIRVEEIVWGGVRVDGIPPLDRPAAVAPADADWLTPGEAVFGVAAGGEARAYPLRIMDWHEMANDVLGGVPFSLAYCTLCGAGIAYDGRAPDGETYDFGTSGVPLPQQQADVRPRHGHALEPVHRRAGARRARGRGGRGGRAAAALAAPPRAHHLGGLARAAPRDHRDRPRDRPLPPLRTGDALRRLLHRRRHDVPRLEPQRPGARQAFRLRPPRRRRAQGLPAPRPRRGARRQRRRRRPRGRARGRARRGADRGAPRARRAGRLRLRRRGPRLRSAAIAASPPAPAPTRCSTGTAASGA